MDRTIYIKKVIAKSDTKEDAIIEFTKGLNIISGRSDTGKSCIMKCIDFCLGSKNLPFEESVVNYNEVSITISSYLGDIILTRKLKDKTKIHISLPNNNKNNYYKIKNTDKTSFNDILLDTVNITERHNILKNSFYESSSLTLRQILQLYIYDAVKIGFDKSVLLPKESTSKTALLSTLNFMICGDDLSSKTPLMRKEVKEAQKEAIKVFANHQIEYNKNLISKLESDLKIYNDENVETILISKIDELQATEKQIKNKVSNRNKLLNDIQDFQDKIIESEVSLSRCKDLQSQYEADIERLTFITEGNIELSNIKNVDKCPFCDSDIHDSQSISYIDLSRNELSSIIIQYNELIKNIDTLSNEIVELKTQLKSTLNSKNKIENELREILNPKINELRQYIDKTNQLILLRSKKNTIDDMSTQISNGIRDEIDKIDMIDTKDKKYKPIDYITNSSFNDDMNNNLREILNHCGYDKNNAISFNIKDFDIEINGNKKSIVNGKGYCSFLNTITILALRKFLSTNAKYNVGFFIIDCPLATLDETNNNNNLTESLYKYMIENQRYGQLIIFEDTKNMPDLSKYKTTNDFNHILFTADKNNGRYGFLNDTFNKEIND